MQPSQKAIEREFEALRDIRRRSSSHGGPGSLLLDPDLPAEQPTTAPPLSPQAWAAKDNAKAPALGQQDGASTNDGGSAVDDPFHLFWVPAHLHPELAPSEFRAFLKEHAHAPPADGLGTVQLGRSSSASSDLGRKRSMLSRQYKPRDNDGVEEEHVVPLRRNKSIFAQEGPQLTISDLQKLEELADEASKSEDPTKLRRVLRRSMTLNVAPSFLDQMDDVPDTTDDADAPIIVPPRNQILRRTARTKIRKPNLSGDGGGHRFPASRRKSAGRANSVDVITSPTDGSSSGHGEIEPSVIPPPPRRRKTLEPEEPQDNRRFTYTDEASIFDAYAEGPEDESPQQIAQALATLPAPVVVETPVVAPSRPSISEPPIQPQTGQPQPSPDPVLYQPQPQRLLSPQQQQQVLQQPPSRTPSPEATSPSAEIQRPESRSSVTSEAPSHHSMASTTTDKRKEKDKKSLWRKVGGSSDKSSKKSLKEKEKDKDKEKEGGFFGSLFGGSKKKQEESAPSSLGGGAGPATAAALLGASKSNNKAYSPSISPQLGNPYARYPIHVERAVYRLSHIKLANPRRPLYEQVLISNLMFWYLGVINKSNQGPGAQNQNQQQQAQNQGGGAQNTQGQGGGGQQDNAQAPPQTGSEKEHLEEQREREERERVERERVDAREKTEQRREPRRGSLTKPPPGGGPASGGRRAEMAVKGPQYHLQSQVIEQEYGGPAPVTRTSSAPPSSIPQSQGYNGSYSPRVQSMQASPKQQQQPSSPQQQQQQQMYSQPNGNPNYYYGRSASLDFTNSPPSGSSLNSSLPPGAMAPLSTNDQTWLSSSQAGRNQQPTSPVHGYSQSTDFSSYSLQTQQQPPRPSRSPPGNAINSSYDWGRNGELPPGAKTPTRSLSANAASAPPVQSQGQYHGHYTHHAHHAQPYNGGANFGLSEGGTGAGAGAGAGGLRKKMASASAVSPERRQRTSDDEDVPLAMWQAQRRK
ncbi:uncharacterized protein FOMMEDRAFT_15989 [Fomitiporia mediterranea MF3/22]|uniref:uncharacterized protein n=1 Tax=Fomitiporia mediterranea (strain MF3/22) TaxID=694068 RepID=UPI0004407FC9|nr:uncharacterized protein FOMMEDRAFT_15989 [Fomitiporia mediterranea MF3/22]EJD07286.1 hypothetical protein FOMMEDRAFT_15989 [Fomitiporia mediterranea MF3/22]